MSSAPVAGQLNSLNDLLKHPILCVNKRSFLKRGLHRDQRFSSGKDFVELSVWVCPYGGGILPALGSKIHLACGVP